MSTTTENMVVTTDLGIDEARRLVFSNLIGRLRRDEARDVDSRADADSLAQPTRTPSSTTECGSGRS